MKGIHTPVIDSDGNSQVESTYERASDALKCAQSVAGEEQQNLLEQSFQDFVWLWEESLTYRPHFVGVRSSFMLSKFHELAQHHPPAATYLDQELNRLQSKVEQGCCAESDFYDLVSLNWKDESQTRSASAMHTLLTSQPDLAQTLGPTLWSTWVEAEDWTLFKRYAPDPREIMSMWIDEYRRYEDSVQGKSTGRGSAGYRQAKLRGNQRRFEQLHNAYTQAGLLEEAQVLDSMKTSLTMTC